MRSVILAAAAATLAVICGHGAVQAQDAEALFKATCSSCHSQKKVLDGVRKKPEADRLAHLEKFLAGHFAPDPGERKAICEHLVKAAAK
jgi:cytochrome c551/c552